MKKLWKKNAKDCCVPEIDTYFPYVHIPQKLKAILPRYLLISGMIYVDRYHIVNLEID